MALPVAAFSNGTLVYTQTNSLRRQLFKLNFSSPTLTPSSKFWLVAGVTGDGALAILKLDDLAMSASKLEAKDNVRKAYEC